MKKVWDFFSLWNLIFLFGRKIKAEKWILCLGKALLKFKQGIVSDPFGALSNWVDDDVAVDPCNWFGVECSDGSVVVL